MRKKALFVGDLNALKDLGEPERGREMLRLGIIAELDAVNLYTQMSEMAEDTSIKKIMIDIAKEEKTHAGEFQALLEMIDKEYKSELDAGKKEVEDKTEGGGGDDDKKAGPGHFISEEKLKKYDKNANLINSMMVIADTLDDCGMVKEASVIDGIMNKLAFRASHIDVVVDNTIKSIKRWMDEQVESDDLLFKAESVNVRDLVTRIIAHIDRYLKHDVNRHGRFVRLSLDSAEETYVDDVMLPALRADGKPWARDIIDKLPSVI